MVHFLRTKNGTNIIETEICGRVEDGSFYLHSHLYPVGYGAIILRMQDDGYHDEVIRGFILDISEIDEVMRELHRNGMKYSEKEIGEIVKEKYTKISKEYGLRYITD